MSLSPKTRNSIDDQVLQMGKNGSKLDNLYVDMKSDAGAGLDTDSQAKSKSKAKGKDHKKAQFGKHKQFIVTRKNFDDEDE